MNLSAQTLGEEAQKHYEIIIDDPVEVSRQMIKGLEAVTRFRRKHQDAYHFNAMLTVDDIFQLPFEPSHESMTNLKLNSKLPPHKLAANLRRAMSGIVAGNIKEDGIAEIRKHGPFQLKGERALMERVDILLQSFVDQYRMKLPGTKYEPCYQVIAED